MSRAAFDKDAYIVGKKGEKILDAYLAKQNFDYVYLNKDGDAFLDHDFILHLKKTKVLLECETKDKFYKRYFDEGIHFQEHKVKGLCKYKIPALYCLLIKDGNTVEVYWNTAKELRKYGEVKPVDNRRKKGELFCIVPENKVKKWIWTIDPMESFI